MTYPEVIKYLNSFINYERIPRYPYKQSLKLGRIKEFLHVLNNPQNDLKSIHIAGTKGKGSTCAFVANILRKAGYKIGLYTSPHLSDFRERIRVLDPCPLTRTPLPVTPYPLPEFEGMISEEELSALAERLSPEIDKYNSRSKYGALSFFEVYTALAFEYFKEKGIDFAVLETGLGGRLDATNAVDSLISAMTPISYEHTRQLGITLSEIAFEKAGIIKNSCQLPVASCFAQDASSFDRLGTNTERRRSVGCQAIVITAPQEEEAMKVIRDRCSSQGAVLYEIGKDIIFERKEFCRNYQSFNISGEFGELLDLKINLLGMHQVINATLAVAIVSALSKFFKIRVGLEAIRSGLYNTIWPGRFEITSQEPQVILDGAQNVASAKALKETIAEIFSDKRVVLVLGISKDKDIAGICRELCPFAEEIILTQADNPRAADVDGIGEVIRSQMPAGYRINKARKVREAIELASQKAGPEDLILVTGSLFLVGEVRDLLRAESEK
ncbi:MAG: folylpolyglutamate synthase/dihydrofolate synthase family protein [Candidatus Omnitrophota bacterium]